MLGLTPPADFAKLTSYRSYEFELDPIREAARSCLHIGPRHVCQPPRGGLGFARCRAKAGWKKFRPSMRARPISGYPADRAQPRPPHLQSAICSFKEAARAWRWAGRLTKRHRGRGCLAVASGQKRPCAKPHTSRLGHSAPTTHQQTHAAPAPPIPVPVLTHPLPPFRRTYCGCRTCRTAGVHLISR